MQPNSNKDLINNLPRLQWACRRGMLELDVLLSNFLKEKYSTLTLPEKEAFVKLLNCTDPEIFAWLMGHETPKSEFTLIVNAIRHHAQNRH